MSQLNVRPEDAHATIMPAIKDIDFDVVFSKKTAANDDKISIFRLRKELRVRGLTSTKPLLKLKEFEKRIAAKVKKEKDMEERTDVLVKQNRSKKERKETQTLAVRKKAKKKSAYQKKTPPQLRVLIRKPSPNPLTLGIAATILLPKTRK